MYELAKSAREKLKAKARSMAAAPSLAKGQDTTSATWSPAEALNADAKTGARPVGKARLYKKGGKVASGKAAVRADRKPRKAGGRVETEIGIGMSNKDVRAANEKREGIKHVGGFKKGGGVKDAGVKEKKALGDIDPSPKRGAAQHYKKGGKTKKEFGGQLSGIMESIRGRLGKKEDTPAKASAVTAANLPPEMKVPVRASRQNFTPGLPAAAQKAIGAFGRKKGGKVKKADGGRLPSPEEAIGSEERLKGIKAMPGKSATPAAQVTPEQLRREEGYSEADRKATRKAGGRTGRADGGAKIDDRMNQAMNAMGKVDTSGYKQVQPYKEPKNPQPAEFELSQLHNRGGRAKRATGGPALSIAGMKMPKKASRKGGKTDINIVINAGKAPPRPPMDDAMPPDGGPALPPPMPPMGAGAPPPAAPPMGGPGAGPMLPPGLPLPGRKAGGRITKVAKSYKDLEAGAGSGEGRLEKTDIAELHKDAPARKAGGRISKVAKSYKGMTAGAESGEGRLQKTDIAKAKMVRGK